MHPGFRLQFFSIIAVFVSRVSGQGVVAFMLRPERIILVFLKNFYADGLNKDITK